MTPSQTTRYRARLIVLREELVEAQRATVDDVKPVVLDQNAVGRVSRGDAMLMQQMALESARRRERQLIAVGLALKRLDDGAFGTCIDCDEDIDCRRLDIDPTTTRCVTCAGKVST